MICHYCKTNPGLKLHSDCVWAGFRDTDMDVYVCNACKYRHYYNKRGTEHRFLYSEFPVVMPPAQLTLKLR